MGVLIATAVSLLLLLAALLFYAFKPVENMTAAIAALLERFGPDARWAIVPDGLQGITISVKIIG